MQLRVARQLRAQRRLQRDSGRSGRIGRKNDVADVRMHRRLIRRKQYFR